MNLLNRSRLSVSLVKLPPYKSTQPVFSSGFVHFHCILWSLIYDFKCLTTSVRKLLTHQWQWLALKLGKFPNDVWGNSHNKFHKGLGFNKVLRYAVWALGARLQLICECMSKYIYIKKKNGEGRVCETPWEGRETRVTPKSFVISSQWSPMAGALAAFMLLICFN